MVKTGESTKQRVRNIVVQPLAESSALASSASNELFNSDVHVSPSASVALLRACQHAPSLVFSLIPLAPTFFPPQSSPDDPHKPPQQHVNSRR
jgi:hypothetical protein